jgi:hypothetical protein
VDKRINASEETGTIVRDLKAGDEEVEHWRARLESLGKQWETLAPARTRAKAELASLADPAALAARVHQCRAQLEFLKNATIALEREFTDYRNKYRDFAWRKAVGEQIGDLTLPGGRTYHNAVVRGVTAQGIDIRHDSGGARIDVRDMDAAWRDRLQFDTLPQEIPKPTNAAPRQPPRTVPAAPTKPAATDTEAEELLQKTREAVIRSQAKVSRLSREYSTARSNAGSYGGPRSAPGSLETWEARANRLAKDLERARLELTTARAALVRIAPADPLARPPLEPGH